MNFKDEKIENDLSKINDEIKQKRDDSKVNSEEKRYYRSLSKNLDKIANRRIKKNES